MELSRSTHSMGRQRREIQRKKDSYQRSERKTKSGVVESKGGISGNNGW